jgi:hypothetical protein
VGADLGTNTFSEERRKKRGRESQVIWGLGSRLGTVAHTYNPTYSGTRDLED